MFRLTVQRCMHDRKIPNITRSHVFPTVLSSYDSPKKYDQSKPIIKKEPKTWKNVWPKYRVHSQQYREYKATRGDGQPIASWNKQPQTESNMWRNADATGSGGVRKHGRTEEEEEAIWAEVNALDSVETVGKAQAYESFKNLFKKTTT